MKATPINDFFAKDGTIRADGRMVHDMYLVAGEDARGIEGPVGLLQDRSATIPADEAFRPLADGSCKLRQEHESTQSAEAPSRRPTRRATTATMTEHLRHTRRRCCSASCCSA